MAKSTPTKAKAKAKAKPQSTTASAAAKPKVTVRTVSAAKPRLDYKTLLSKRFNRDVKLGAMLAELTGTFVLTTMVLLFSANPLIAGLAVLVLVAALWNVSGAHLNPAITVSLWASRKISGLRATAYIIAQLLGAMLAVVVVSQFLASAPPSVNPLSGETQAAQQVFTLEKLVGDWRPFLAETLGAVVLGLGVAAAVTGKREGLEKGWLIGGALFIGLFVASQGFPSTAGASAVLNPAVALGASAYQFSNMWTLWVYALAPAFGASVGVWLYQAMKWELRSSNDSESA